VSRVLTASVAELRELKPAGGRLLVLRGGVVPVLAIRALQCNDLAHYVSSLNVASHLGWQAACTELLPTRRDAGQWPLLPNPDFVSGRLSGQATLCLIYYPTKLQLREARLWISVSVEKKAANQCPPLSFFRLESLFC
jgi:hypothetical protein